MKNGTGSPDVSVSVEMSPNPMFGNPHLQSSGSRGSRDEVPENPDNTLMSDDDSTSSLRSLGNSFSSRKRGRPYTRGQRRQTVIAESASVETEHFEGINNVVHSWRTFWWAFLIHLVYPFGPIYVRVFNGLNAFKNLRFGFTTPTEFFFTHILLGLPSVVTVFALRDPVAMHIYKWELLALWFSHISRVLGIAVKYSHCPKHVLDEFLCHDVVNEAEAVTNDLMLPSGWFQPTYRQWLPIIKRAEDLASSSIAVQALTMGNGLRQHIEYVGNALVSSMDGIIRDYEERPEMKTAGFTVHRSTKSSAVDGEGNGVPVIEISVGLVVIALLDADNLKSAHVSMKANDLRSVVLGIIPSCLGIFFRLYKGEEGGGDHPASGLFIFTIVYCSFWNWWSFYRFLETAVVDYQRRYLLQYELLNMLHPNVMTDQKTGTSTVVPAMLNMRRGHNSAAYLCLRQTLKHLGKDYRLRLGWIVSYSMFVCVAFMVSFLQLAFSSAKRMGVEHVYAVWFLFTVSVFILRAIKWANKYNEVPTKELRYVDIQILQAYVDERKHLMLHDGTDNSKMLELQSNSIGFLQSLRMFIEHDDIHASIKIAGVRADWKLLQLVAVSFLGFLGTLVEVVGLETILGLE